MRVQSGEGIIASFRGGHDVVPNTDCVRAPKAKHAPNESLFPTVAAGCERLRRSDLPLHIPDVST